MSNFFRNLGRKTGTHITKAKWVFDSLAGEENDSIRAELEMGAALVKDFRHSVQLCPDERIGPICAKLAERLANDNWCITPQAIDSQNSEAFSLPGGFIFITKPLINFCAENDDRLAFVLAHEIGHVVKRHAIRRVATDQAATFFNRAIASRTPATRMLSPFVGQLIEKGYSEEQEFAADDFSQRLCKAAGYDRDAGVNLMKELLELDQDLSVVSKHFAAHPPLKRRIARLQES